MIDNSLMEFALPAELVISGFIPNDPNCNCEKYILEFINKSSFFLNKSKGQQYSPPPSEASGECDYNTDSYLLDLKLIGAQSSLSAKSNLSYGKTLIAPGVLATHASKGRKGQKAGRIHALLRDKNLQQLRQIRNKSTGLNQEEKDVSQFLKKLETKKNLLLFFPYEMRFSDGIDFGSGLSKIQDALYSDFSVAMQYRASMQPNFDTFFTFLYARKIIFLESTFEGFSFVDSVSLEESPIFMKLAAYADWA